MTLNLSLVTLKTTSVSLCSGNNLFELRKFVLHLTFCMKSTSQRHFSSKILLPAWLLKVVLLMVLTIASTVDVLCLLCVGVDLSDGSPQLHTPHPVKAWCLGLKNYLHHRQTDLTPRLNIWYTIDNKKLVTSGMVWSQLIIAGYVHHVMILEHIRGRPGGVVSRHLMHF